MKVVYKKQIAIRILDAIRAAKKECREIDYIELDREAFDNFLQHLSLNAFAECINLDNNFVGVWKVKPECVTYMGVDICKKEIEKRIGTHERLENKCHELKERIEKHERNHKCRNYLSY